MRLSHWKWTTIQSELLLRGIRTLFLWKWTTISTSVAPRTSMWTLWELSSTWRSAWGLRIGVKFICGLKCLAVLRCGQQWRAGVSERRARLFDGRGDDVFVCSWERWGKPRGVPLLGCCDLLCRGKQSLRLDCFSPCYMLGERKRKDFVSEPCRWTHPWQENWIAVLLSP